MPEPDDLAALTAELEEKKDFIERYDRKTTAISKSRLDRILAALRQAREMEQRYETLKRHYVEDTEEREQTIAELRAGLEAIALDRCHCSCERAHELIEGGYCNSCIARQTLARTTSPPEGK